MKKSIEIAYRRIGAKEPPYVIAEISGNHNGSLDRALMLVRKAKDCGADAVKTQTYTPDTITMKSSRSEFRISGGLWDGKTLYELYEWAHTPWDWMKELFALANELDITMFSSAFDHSAVDYLEALDCPAYKVASFEAVDLRLIDYIARTGKPMIISTGMADKAEIREAVDAAVSGGCSQLAILHCVSGYPAPAEDYNLMTIPDMHAEFGLPVGLSDHTLGNVTAIASVALGAAIIEKHVTLDRAGGGPDDAFSMEPEELANLCKSVRTAWMARGGVDYGRKSSESGNTIFRRSLYFQRDMPSGHVLREEDIRSIRPGNGLPPKAFASLVGRKLARTAESGTPVAWDYFETGAEEDG